MAKVIFLAMNGHYTANSKIKINAGASTVWDAITNPKVIKKYLHGTNAVSDWKVGSPIIFKGEWNGKTYEDKGTILRAETQRLLEYSWWSSLRDLEDKPENYAKVTFQLNEDGKGTELSVTQDNIHTKAEAETSKKNWTAVLQNIKLILEK